MAKAEPKFPYTLPRAPKNEQQYVLVGVNAKTYQVPKGKTSMVPQDVDFALHWREAMTKSADNYIDTMESISKV